MKRFIYLLIAVAVVFFLLPSCGPHILENETDALIVAEAVIASVTPFVDQSFQVDSLAKAPALFGYEQPGGGTIEVDYVSNPVWGSSQPEPESDADLYIQVTLVDFLSPAADGEYLINAVVTFNYAFINGETDKEFIFTIWGSGVSLSGEGLEDTFDVDVQAFLDIDIVKDGVDCTASISGSVVGVIAGISIDVPEWSFSFGYDDPYS